MGTFCKCNGETGSEEKGIGRETMTEGDGKFFSKNIIGRDFIFISKRTKTFSGRAPPEPAGEVKRSPKPLSVVTIAVEWKFPSGSLAAFRNALLQGALA